MPDIQGQLQRLTEQTREVGRKVDDVKETVGRIETYLYDDPKTDAKGLVSQVRAHGRALLKMEQADMVRKARSSVWGVVGGGAVVILYKLIALAVTLIK